MTLASDTSLVIRGLDQHGTLVGFFEQMDKGRCIQQVVARTESLCDNCSAIDGS